MTVSFTGHRPNKLGGYDWYSDLNKRILKNLYKTILDLIQNRNANTFIFGGALGIDQMAFAVTSFIKRKFNYDIKLIIAVPFKDQYIKWNKNDVKKYNDQLKEADEIIYVDELKDTKYFLSDTNIGIYDKRKLQLRNMYMVDHSDLLVSFWNSTPGGTANCTRYALDQKKETLIINPYNL